MRLLALIAHFIWQERLTKNRRLKETGGEMILTGDLGRLGAHFPAEPFSLRREKKTSLASLASLAYLAYLAYHSLLFGKSG
jgi:hypothetical protein